MMQITRAPGGVEGAQNFLATDDKGQITFATTGIAKLLGYAGSRDLLKLGNISGLMELPFSHMHAKWLAVSARPFLCTSIVHLCACN